MVAISSDAQDAADVCATITKQTKQITVACDRLNVTSDRGVKMLQSNVATALTACSQALESARLVQDTAQKCADTAKEVATSRLQKASQRFGSAWGCVEALATKCEGSSNNVYSSS